MQSKYKSLVSNTFIFALGSFGSKLITFFLVPLYTNVLTTRQYGTADLIITCANMVVPLLSLVIQDSIIRFGLSKNIDTGSVIKNAFIVLGIGSLMAVVLTPLYDFYPALAEWKYYLLCISITNMFSNVMFAYAKAIEKNKLYSLASVLNAGILAVSNIIFLVFLRLDIQGYLLGNIIAHLLSVLVIIIYTDTIKTVVLADFNKSLLVEMLKYSVPLVVNNLSWWFLTSANRLMIERFCSVDSLGLYAAGSKIPNLVFLVTGIFSQAWTLSAIKEYDFDQDKSFYANVFKTFCVFLFVTCSIIIFISKPLMYVYVGRSFFESWKFVSILVVGASYYAISAFFGAIYGALKKNVNVTFTTVIAALVNLVINFIFLRRVGVFAAVFATAFSYFIIGMYRMFDTQRFFSFVINYKKIIMNTIVIWTQAVLVSFEIGNYYLTSILSLLAILAINCNELRDLKFIMSKLSNRYH